MNADPCEGGMVYGHRLQNLRKRQADGPEAGEGFVGRSSPQRPTRPPDVQEALQDQLGGLLVQGAVVVAALGGLDAGGAAGLARALLDGLQGGVPQVCSCSLHRRQGALVLRRRS